MENISRNSKGSRQRSGKRNGRVAVYGKGLDREELLRQLKGRGVGGRKALLPAGCYVLMGSEEENFSFYAKYKNRLRDKPVFLKCNSRDFQAADTNLHFFCPEEIAARIYGRQAGIYEQAREKGYRLKIVILGFGRLEQELLLWGLQNHIFSPDQKLEYHVFGDGSKFCALYHELGQIRDPVIFHREPWYEELALLQGADRILIRDGQELRELLFALPEKTIDVLAGRGSMHKLLEDQERLRIFYWEQEAGKPAYIFREKLFLRAKELNLEYAHIYSQVEKTEENRETLWKELDTFTRYSNISSADYHEVRLAMLEDWKREQKKSHPDQDYLEYLAQLEHIRWCRYHYLNNWQQGMPKNGKHKDKKRRIHKDLVPYEELSEADREKDREKVSLLLSMKLR